MVSPNLFKKYYCKIKGKNYGPLTLEELKGLAIQGQLQISDKVSLTFPTKEWLQASSIAALNEIFKTQADNSNSKSFVFEETQADNNYVANYFKTDGVAINEENPSGFSQGVNLELLEKNSIEIVKLLRNIYGWMNFYFYAGMVVAFVTILAALVNNKGR